jgi:hypothetical protein
MTDLVFYAYVLLSRRRVLAIFEKFEFLCVVV